MLTADHIFQAAKCFWAYLLRDGGFAAMVAVSTTWGKQNIE
jgi:hypothetical protein